MALEYKKYRYEYPPMELLHALLADCEIEAVSSHLLVETELYDYLEAWAWSEEAMRDGSAQEVFRQFRIESDLIKLDSVRSAPPDWPATATEIRFSMSSTSKPASSIIR